MANDYKDTLFLPKTDFPMRANLSQREPEFLKFWYDIDVYNELKKKNKDKQDALKKSQSESENGSEKKSSSDDSDD